MTAIEEASDAVGDALPADWEVSEPVRDEIRDMWHVSATGPRPSPGQAYPAVFGSGADATTALRQLESKLRRRPPYGGVYNGPGWEVGFVIVPVVTGIAAVAGIVVALIATVSDGIRVALAAFLTGVIGWIALWAIIERLHPRFSEGTADMIRSWLVVVGPPVLAVAAAVAVR